MTLEIYQTVDEYLDSVDYSFYNTGSYVPSLFSLNFINFIKLVNGATGESHPSPPVHMAMLDKLAGPKERLANLCSRGLAKTTLFGEYLIPYIGVFEGIEGFGRIDGMIYVSDSMENGVKSMRKNIEYRYHQSDFLQEWLPEAHFTDNYMEFKNKNGHRLGIKMFGAKTGLRGTKIFGKRPTLAVLDDLVSDDDSKSKAAMIAIKDTVYKGIDYALDPTKRKIVFNGTPFNKNDILYEAVESGAWEVNVWPICEKFPCEPEEFRGAWEERFSYEFVKSQYETSKLTGQLSAFNQELMLRVASEDERLVQDGEINWYSQDQLMKNQSNFNFFLTSDFAVSEKQSADFTVMGVWAINNNGDMFLVDGQRGQQTLDVTMDHLFRLAVQYKFMSAGIEVSGQQAGFIPYIQSEMMKRNVYFTLASANNGKHPGIRSVSDKISRFNMILPSFKRGKMFFPNELRNTQFMQAILDELRMATPGGFKSKNDDCVDMISQLAQMNMWLPSESPKMEQVSKTMWDMEDHDESTSNGFSGYTV